MSPGSSRFRLYRHAVPGIVALGVLVVLYIFIGNRVGEPEQVQLAAPVVIEASTQRQGDPQSGKRHLLNSPYVSCGLPKRVATKLGNVDPALLLPDRKGAGSELAYFNNLVRDGNGQEIVASNCLICHAAPLFGQIVIGLGNEFLDFTEDPSRAIERAGTLVNGPLEEQAWRKLADRIGVVAPYIVADTVGANIANNLTFALMAHRDVETLAWSDEPFIEPPDTYPLPVSVPPWWRMAKKNAMFYQGQARGDHARFMMTASILCADDLEEVKKTDVYAADIRAYIASLEPPAYPFAIDRELAARGQAVFQSTCARCHGSADDPDAYPNLLVPLEIIGTDPALAVQAAVEYRRFTNWAGRSYFGQGTRFEPQQGYMPPPLDGVWATGPFLHNGSVPTIAALLDSSTRPAYWRHTPERVYDQEHLGWSYRQLDTGKDPAGTHNENKWIYDTSLRGYSNAGHLFGDHLGPPERAALLEFLKTL